MLDLRLNQAQPAVFAPDVDDEAILSDLLSEAS